MHTPVESLLADMAALNADLNEKLIALNTQLQYNTYSHEDWNKLVACYKAQPKNHRADMPLPLFYYSALMTERDKHVRDGKIIADILMAKPIEIAPAQEISIPSEAFHLFMFTLHAQLVIRLDDEDDEVQAYNFEKAVAQCLYSDSKVCDVMGVSFPDPGQRSHYVRKLVNAMSKRLTEALKSGNTIEMWDTVKTIDFKLINLPSVQPSLCYADIVKLYNNCHQA